MNDNQNGNAAVALISSIMALGFVTLATQQINLAVKHTIHSANSDNERAADNDGLMSTAARFKALLRERRDPITSVYKPALYAADYFRDKWTIKKNSAVPSETFDLDPNSGYVVTKTKSKSNESLTLSVGVFQGASSISQFQETFRFRVQNVNRATTGPAKGLLVESADVEVTKVGPENGTEQKKSYVRIPLSVPKAYKPELLFRRKNSGFAFQVLTSSKDLTADVYQFKARASGVFVGMNLIIDGVEHKMGYTDFNNITHGGRNYDALDVEMPEIVEADLGAGGEAGTTAGDGVSSSCLIKATDGGHSIVLELVHVNGETVSAQQFTTSSPTTKTRTAMEIGIAKHGMTLDDYASVCNKPDQCLYLGGTPTANGLYDTTAIDQYWRIDNKAGPIGDVSSAWHHQIAMGHYQLVDKKLCSRIDYKTMDPNRPDYTAARTFITYQKNTCEPRFYQERTHCGCVAEDTLITLGDGKSAKRIDQLVQSDLIWNPVLKKAMKMRRVTRGPELIPMFEISADGRKVSVTRNHPFPTPDGMKTAYSLTEGDEIKLESDKWVKIESIKTIPVGTKAPVVWNIELEGPSLDWDAHHYLANGVVTGDLLIQTELQSSNLDPRILSDTPITK